MRIRFFIYGLLGLIVETLWTGFGSLFNGDVTMYAFTYIWMFPIYGLAIFLEPVHDRIRHLSVVVRGGIYAVLIFSIEYTTGWILKILIGQCPWNYGPGPYSIDGIITLTFIPVWFAAGLAFEVIHNILVRRGVGELNK